MIQAHGYVIYIADKDGNVFDWKFAATPNDLISFFIVCDDGSTLWMNTNAGDMPRMCEQKGYIGTVSEFTIDIPHKVQVNYNRYHDLTYTRVFNKLFDEGII